MHFTNIFSKPSMTNRRDMKFSPKLLVLLLFAFCTAELSAEEEPGPIVVTKYGNIEGEFIESCNGGYFAAFAGIPYAKPPVDRLRFEAPEPPEPWSNILTTSTMNYVSCPQLMMGTIIMGQENCLYINVYTPKLYEQPNSVLPVLVFIHGGAFSFGSANFLDYGPNRFMDRDVVLVTFNYRLGPLGFLAAGDDELPGNYGFLDQIAALKWIQENIEGFNGNKSQVTIFGISAGGAGITAMILSPLAKGLFHGAISQSGSLTCPWGIEVDAGRMARFLAIKLQCVTYPTSEMKKCLQEKPFQELITMTAELAMVAGLSPVFKPAVDKRVIPDDPTKLFQEGRINNVPIIMGITDSEAGGIYTAFRLTYTTIGIDSFKEELPDLFEMSNVRIAPSKMDEFLNLIVKIYAKDQDMDNATTYHQILTEILSDAMFSCAQNDAILIANSNGYPTYIYTFNFQGSVTMALISADEELGTSHGDDIQYLFFNMLNLLMDMSEEDEKMINIFLDFWTNFAKTGNPTPAEGSGGEKMPFTWPPYTKGNRKCIYLNANPTETDHCKPENTALWTEEMKKIEFE